ncbi:hypothetical protein BDW68DRAFT_180006 [Aspergillus falconensis]
MRAYILLIAFLGAFSMATPAPTETAAVVGDGSKTSNFDNAPEIDDLLIADGF